MALVLTPEQEKALLIVADREIARKATEDALAGAEAALRAVEAQFEQARRAVYVKAESELATVNQTFALQIRDAKLALDEAVNAKIEITKPVDIAAEVVKDVVIKEPIEVEKP